MPIRMLRDWTGSERVNSLSVHAERFFTRLIMKVDDYGCFYADTRLLKASLFPLLLDSVREADMLRWMAECQKAGLIVLYEGDSKKYLQILDFKQRLDKARSRFPLPSVLDINNSENEFPPEIEIETEQKPKKRLAKKADPVGAFEDREKVFYKTLAPYVETYGKEMIRAFYDYWRESNKANTKMRWEQEKTWNIDLRLKRWANHDKGFKNKVSVNGIQPVNGSESLRYEKL